MFLNTLKRFAWLTRPSSNFFATSTSQPAAAPKNPTPRAAEQETEEMTADLYYRELLRKTKVHAEKKRQLFDQSHLIRMTKLANKPEDGPLVLEAFYNFLGHYTSINNTTIDSMVSKYLRIGSDPKAIVELFQNHAYLMYFPHYSATQSLVRAVSEDPVSLNELCKAFLKNRFIKLNTTILESISNSAAAGEDQELLRNSIKLLFAPNCMTTRKDQPLFFMRTFAKLAPEVQSIENETVEAFFGTINSKLVTLRGAIDIASIKENTDINALAIMMVSGGEFTESVALLAKIEGQIGDEFLPYYELLRRRVAPENEEPNKELMGQVRDELKVFLEKKKRSEAVQNLHKEIVQLLKDSLTEEGSNKTEKTDQQ